MGINQSRVTKRNHWKMPEDVPDFIHTELNQDKKYNNIKNYSPTKLYYSPSLLEKRRLDYLHKSYQDTNVS